MWSSWWPMCIRDTAWHDYDEAKLAKMWEYHDYCLQAAIDYKGGND